MTVIQWLEWRSSACCHRERLPVGSRKGLVEITDQILGIVVRSLVVIRVIIVKDKPIGQGRRIIDAEREQLALV